MCASIPELALAFRPVQIAPVGNDSAVGVASNSLNTLTRVSPEGKVFFAVYAAGDAQIFADNVGLAIA